MSANFLNQNNWDNVTNEQRNNLVFQHRNHEYGAFVIRRDYNHNVFIALLLSTIFFLGVGFLPKLFMDAPIAAIIKVPIIDDNIVVQIDYPIERIIEITPPAPVELPKPIAQQNNTSLVVSDKPVVNELAVNSEIINPGTKTIDGPVAPPIIEPLVPNTKVIESASSGVAISVEVMPEFPGGVEALFSYLGRNINYPNGAKLNGIKGTVIVGFVIDKTGKAVNLTILRGIRGGKDLEQEAMRVIAAMPAWSIGKQNGIATAVQFSLPVRFELR